MILLLSCAVLFLYISEETTKISFTAIHPQAVLYKTPGSRLRFTEVLTDTTNSFNKNNMEYVCPKTGIYFFSFCLYSGILKRNGDNYRSGAQLFINKKAIIDTLAFNDDPDYHMVASTCQIITHMCKRTQRVYLNTRFAPNYIGNFGRTTFTGFKLF